MSAVTDTQNYIGVWRDFDLTLASGTGTIKTPFSKVLRVSIIQTGTPVAEGFKYSSTAASDGTQTVTITSSNATSTAALRVSICGVY